MLEGEFQHEDFVGHKGTIGPGVRLSSTSALSVRESVAEFEKGVLQDLQFMIAGKGALSSQSSSSFRSGLTDSCSRSLGIMHAEMPIHGPGKKDPFGLQLSVSSVSSLPSPHCSLILTPCLSPFYRWIDLPKEHKLVEPSYQELKSSQIPSAHPSPNTLVKVICGESDGSSSEGVITSPVRPLGGCWFTDWTMSGKGEKGFQRVPKGWNSFVCLISLAFISIHPIRQHGADKESRG